MPGTCIKICGITRPQDALRAAELGADAIGLNFVGGPRQINEPNLTSAIYWTLRDADSPVHESRIQIVALCATNRVEQPGATPWNELNWVGADVYQIYGRDHSGVDASPLLIGRWWMVFHLDNRESLVELAVSVGIMKTPPAAILLDTASPSQLGGTGQTFNWHWIAQARDAGELAGLPPIILAGGLNPDNVADAIRIAKPYAVDVSSGVEVPGQPGIKDPLKMRDFIQAVQGAS